MSAPIGAVVKLYIDSRQQLEVGDVVETEAGRRYDVLTVRVQERGKHRGRQHFSARVMAPDEPPRERTQRIRWYRR
ncbi:hypothetical protein ACEYYH_10565 [Microbacterium trichothecenolyticum]|uniref:hypothetical protein n=1 Tax=Microbacterium trichothecenolyticum TaxID=69370 RepID=UPI0035BE1E5F